MFKHVHELQYEAKPDAPDPAFARRFQEVLGGKWGEMTVAMQYLYQGWNCRLPGKYKDMLLDIGTEELAHVEMITTMIDRLLDAAPLSESEAKGPMEKHFDHSNPQHTIVNGGGGYPADSTASRGPVRSSPRAATSTPTSCSTPPPRCRAGSRSRACST